MHIGWGGGGVGYIQKFLSTVSVPLNYTFLARTQPHTHARNIAYFFLQSIPILL